MNTQENRTDYDVIVVGGGISGSMAAVSAARQGVRVLVIEQQGFLGGMLTAAGVGPMMTFHAGEIQVIQGVTGELINRLKAKGYSPGHVSDTTGYTYSVTPFDLEGMKRELELMVTEAGGKILYHTMLAEALIEENRLTGIRIVNKKGLQVVQGRYFIDATGDADLSWMAGVPCVSGRPEDGRMQPLTMKVRIYNVDIPVVRQFIKDHPEEFPAHKDLSIIDKGSHLSIGGFTGLFKKAKDRGELTIERESILFFEANNPGEIILNTSRIHNVDATDPEALSRAEIEGRRQAEELFRFLRKDMPGFSDARLAFTGPSVGVRSTRQIIGKYTITQDDVLRGRKFGDAVVCNGYPIDIHDPAGTSGKTLFLDWGEYYTIPYRCLINEKITNLVTVGRAISGEFAAQGAFRTTPGCGALGHAGGAAAGLAAATSTDFTNLESRDIQQILGEQGAFLGE